MGKQKVTCTVSTVQQVIETMAPARLSPHWDNPGLQVGDPHAPVRRILTCLELTRPVLAEAARRRVDLIVAHHPLIFKPLNRLDLSDPIGELVGGLATRGIALLAAHMNLDTAAWGTNTVLCEACGLEPAESIEPDLGEPQYKFVVFVPEGHENLMIEAIHNAGGGRIGAYDHCTFRTPGIGTFRPGEGAEPYLGETGRLEQAREVRLETIVTADRRGALVRAARKAHPYEEMAYDLYPIDSPPTGHGLGRMAYLDQPATAEELGQHLKQRLGLQVVRLAGPAGKRVRRVAVCSGGAGDMIRTVASSPAEAFITGELKHHQALEAHARGLPVIELGHYETEVLVAAPLAERLATTDALASAGVQVVHARRHLRPFRYL